MFKMDRLRPVLRQFGSINESQHWTYISLSNGGFERKYISLGMDWMIPLDVCRVFYNIYYQIMLFHIPSYNVRNMKWKMKGHGQIESDHFKLARPLLRSVSLWLSAPIHPLAHLWIALRNNSLSDDHLTPNI